MAKKLVRTKRPAASSSKTVKSSSKNVSKSKAPVKASTKLKYTPKPVTNKKPAKKAPAKTKSAPRVSYKKEYIKLLQDTNKLLGKRVRGIEKELKTIKKSGPLVYDLPADYEAFPKEEPIAPIKQPTPQPLPPESIEQQILDQLRDLELQIRSRDMAFEELISGSAKIGGDEF